MDSPRQSTPRRRAKYPRCNECAKSRVPLVSDDPIWVQVGDGDPQLVPRGQQAALLRFLPNYESGDGVVMEHMSFALGGCYKMDQILSALRNDLGIPIPCDLVPKKTKPGSYGLYYLGQGVRRWEPSEAKP